MANYTVVVTSDGTNLVTINSGIKTNTADKTGNYTALVTDSVIFCNATGGGITITLPTVANAGAGFMLYVKKTDASSNTVVLDGAGAETIDGSATFTLAGSSRNGVQICCDGTAWYVMGSILSGRV